MSRIFSFLGKNLAELMALILFLYAFLPILSPLLLLSNPNSTLGLGIQKVYSVFCHQMVDRSLFIGGEKSFYTIEEYSDTAPIWGDHEHGYKVAFCIRDTGLYVALALTGIVLLILMRKKQYKFSWKIIILLLIPMIVDGVFQSIASILQLSWVPTAYIENIPKRIVTGILFGIGSALFIFPNLKESVNLSYNDAEKNKFIEKTNG